MKNTNVIIKFWFIVTGMSKIGYRTNCSTNEIIKPKTTFVIDSKIESRFDCFILFQNYNFIKVSIVINGLIAIAVPLWFNRNN